MMPKPTKPPTLAQLEADLKEREARSVRYKDALRRAYASEAAINEGHLRNTEAVVASLDEDCGRLRRQIKERKTGRAEEEIDPFSLAAYLPSGN